VNEYKLSDYIKNFDSYWGYKWRYTLFPEEYTSYLFGIPNTIIFNNIFLHSKKIDIYHPTYYIKDLNNFKNKHQYASVVLTVHDMIHELYPDHFRDSKSIINAKQLSVNSADSIICVSENTKKDLIRLYDVPDDKITVIYHSNSLSKFDTNLDRTELERTYSITRPFLLYVGDRKAFYKNFSTLFEAYKTSLSDHFDLVCFGGGKFHSGESRMIEEIQSPGKVIHLAGSDYLLASLYKNAFCFVYPSLYEGFGIPPLEAMGMGCPVIASNTSSIPEVVGNAALLFDPYSKKSLIDAVEALESEELRRKLIISGFEQEKKFSWEKTVVETYKVYNRLVS